MKRWTIVAIIAAIIVVFIILAWSLVQLQIPERTLEPEKYGFTVIDDWGRPVTLEKKPERIVSLAPVNTEILFALGLGENVVGVTEFCTYPPEAVIKEKVGGMTTVSVEKVIALNPDLVLALNLNGEETVDMLDDYFPVFVIDPQKAERIEDIFTRIELVGKITEEEERATALVAAMRKRVEGITNKTAGEEEVNVAYIVWHDPIWVTGGGNPQNDLLEKAGGENIFADIEDWGTVSIETLIERNPDVIIVAGGHGAAEMKPYDFIMTDARLAVLNARKEGRVCSIDADIIARPGPRIVEALEETAHCLHPDLF
ncbi:MAG TPA: cobalamin-binding protein [Desulfobacteria bacterium]|nr:cobalamin-binding protein [Desulfobacteria bacterium]